MDDLLYRYFGGELSDTEKRELFTAMENDESLKKKFVTLQNNYALAQMLDQENDREFAEHNLEQLYLRQRKKAKSRQLFRFTAYAAAILFLVGSFFLYRYVSLSPAPVNEIVEYVASKGIRKELLLSDGTKIRLAPGSKIRIPKTFTGNQRLVELDGEALFDVVKNKKMPFIVKTHSYNIRVLGTVFFVDAYKKNTDFKTSLISGSVHVYNQQEELRLTPGQSALSTAQKLYKVNYIDNDLEYLEKGVYRFEEASLQTIVNKLNDWYDGDVKITNPKLAKMSLTGKFKESDDIETLIKVMQNILPFHYKKQANNQIDIY